MDCLACGNTSSPASREHVFSQWLLNEFGLQRVDGALQIHPHDRTSVQVRNRIRLDSFKLKRICEACNNGWMSELESAAKPLILDVIRNARSLDSLREEERRVLARWAGKTSIVESHSIGAECPVSSECLKRIRVNRDGFPGRFAVAASRTEFMAFGHFQAGIIMDLIGGGKASGNIIAIALPRLSFACAFPMQNELPYKCRCVKSLFTPLWPNPAHWEPMNQTPMPPGLDGGEFLAAMVERIELFQPIK